MNGNVSSDQSYRSGKASVTKHLDALRSEFAHIRFGHKRSYRISHLLRDFLLSVRARPGEAAEFAKALSGVKPSDWLAAREAHDRLRRMGVRRGRHFLYRLRRKLAATDGQAEIWLDTRGNWGGRCQVRNAVAVLVVKGGSTPRFQVVPASTYVTESANP